MLHYTMMRLRWKEWKPSNSLVSTLAGISPSLTTRVNCLRSPDNACTVLPEEKAEIWDAIPHSAELLQKHSGKCAHQLHHCHHHGMGTVLPKIGSLSVCDEDYTVHHRSSRTFTKLASSGGHTASSETLQMFLFTLLPSSRRYRSIGSRTTRLTVSFHRQFGL